MHAGFDVLSLHAWRKSSAAFCAVGNPKSFFDHLGRAGYQLVLRKSFADHHIYTQSDVDWLVHAAKVARKRETGFLMLPQRSSGGREERLTLWAALLCDDSLKQRTSYPWQHSDSHEARLS